WAEVSQPLEYAKPFRVRGERGKIATENVRRLHLAGLTSKEPIEIDGAKVNPSRSDWYLREKAGWRPDETGAPDSEKNARKSGPFKLAFGNGFVLVYGASGEESENRELLDLARWISESWWYRGNGSTTVLSDREFLARGSALASRNVILLGNADTNAAWKSVVPGSCPIVAKRGSLRLGEKTHEGAALAALFLYPPA